MGEHDDDHDHDHRGDERDGLTGAVLAWYDVHARDLRGANPVRRPGRVLVSEIMLQQTPVIRVLPAYAAWLARWPTPAALAADSPGEAVRMWAKLGYPATRAQAPLGGSSDHGAARRRGAVDVDALRALPGVGEYTARAVAAFAYGQRAPVVDTNVRRVVARAVVGHGQPGPPSIRRDLAAVEALLPNDPATAARLSVALMELGALVCVARTPRCDACPLIASCRWVRRGRPAYDGPTTRQQRFTGTDRQVRGRLMDVLRAAAEPVERTSLDAAWPEADQRQRALDSLVVDGLVDPLPDGRFALPA